MRLRCERHPIHDGGGQPGIRHGKRPTDHVVPALRSVSGTSRCVSEHERPEHELLQARDRSRNRWWRRNRCTGPRLRCRRESTLDLPLLASLSDFAGCGGRLWFAGRFGITDGRRRQSRDVRRTRGYFNLQRSRLCAQRQPLRGQGIRRRDRGVRPVRKSRTNDSRPTGSAAADRHRDAARPGGRLERDTLLRRPGSGRDAPQRRPRTER